MLDEILFPPQHGDTANPAVAAPFRTTRAVMIKRRRAASAVAASGTSAKRARSKLHTGPAGELTGRFLSKKNHSELDFCLFVSVWRDLY